MISVEDRGEVMARRVDGAVTGLLIVVGSMVEKGCGQDLLWSRRVVSAVLKDVGGGVNTLQDGHISTKTNYFLTLRFWSVSVSRILRGFKNDGFKAR